VRVYVVLNYGFMVPDGKRPKDWEVGIHALSNMNADIIFKPRARGRIEDPSLGFQVSYKSWR